MNWAPTAATYSHFLDECVLCGGRQSRDVFRLFRPTHAEATGRHTEDLFGRAGHFVRCTRCGVVRQAEAQRVPYDGQQDDEYLREELSIRATFRKSLERIRRFRSPLGRLLDVRAGPGYLLDEAKGVGWTASGVEPSAWPSAIAVQRGHDGENGTFEQANLQPDSFDVVVAADVIEHVRAPVAFAERIEHAPAPGGIAYITTPNVNSVVAMVLRWWWSVIPNRLWLFLPRTLDPLLRRAGLSPIFFETHPRSSSLRYYATRLAGYTPIMGSIADGLVRLASGDERLITPDFRDRPAVLAPKD